MSRRLSTAKRAVVPSVPSISEGSLDREPTSTTATHDPGEPKPLVRLRDVGKIYDDDGLQEPATRHQLFVRGAWPRALGSRLELSGFAPVDVLDGSTLAQMLVSFYLLQVVR
jgi:hypothetical protein